MNPPRKDCPLFIGAKPRIIGHRGARGKAPENTIPSFQRALEDGAQFLELDVHGTKAGDLVIIHDATLERTTNGRGQVKRQALKDLKALDAGHWFNSDGGASYPYRGQKISLPTLEEFFGALPKAKTIIEIKQERPPIVHMVIETVRRFGKDEQVLLATEKDVIMQNIRREIQENDLAIATGFSYGEVSAFMGWLARGKSGQYVPPGEALQIPCQYSGMTLVSEETVNAAHDMGVEMYVWTVNDTEEMERLLRLEVDGIITDYPDRLRDVILRHHP